MYGGFSQVQLKVGAGWDGRDEGYSEHLVQICVELQDFWNRKKPGSCDVQ